MLVPRVQTLYSKNWFQKINCTGISQENAEQTEMQERIIDTLARPITKGFQSLAPACGRAACHGVPPLWKLFA